MTNRLAVWTFLAGLCASAAASQTFPSFEAPFTSIPDRAEAFRLYEQGEYVKALPYLESVLWENPSDWQALEALGRCQYRLGRPSEALVSFEKSLSIHPDNPALRAHTDALKNVFDPSHPSVSRIPFTLSTGLAISRLRGGGVPGIRPRTGFMIRISSYHEFSQWMGLDAGAGYIQKGWGSHRDVQRATVDNANTSTQTREVTDARARVDYIELSAAARLKFGPSRAFHVQVGPGLGFLAGTTYDVRTDRTLTRTPSEGPSSTETLTVQEHRTLTDVKGLDAGVITGIGFQAGPFGADFRYDRGMAGVLPSEAGPPSRNESYQFTVGYLF